MHDKKGEYDKALEHYQKALAIELKQLGPEHPDVATSYNNIGLVHLTKPRQEHLKAIGSNKGASLGATKAYVYKAKKDAKDIGRKPMQETGPKPSTIPRIAKAELDALKE